MYLLYGAIIFLIVGMFVGLFGLLGLIAIAAHVPWFIIFVGVLLLVIHYAKQRPHHEGTIEGPHTRI